MKLSIVVQKIKHTLNDYLQQKIDLLTLQAMLSAFRSNFENDIPTELQNKIHEFIEDLEYIRFMRNQDEYFDEASEKIEKLNKFLQRVTPSITLQRQ